MLHNLGRTSTDIITGFTGVITGFAAYISGCNQYLITPRDQDKDGKPEARWIDVQRMKMVADVAPVVLDNTATPGCDIPAPIR